MHAALEIQDETASQEGVPLSIGLHQGRVTIGSTRIGGMLDFIAHGHPVRVTHKMAELAAERGKGLLASGEFVNLLGGRLAEDSRHLEGGLVVGKAEISMYTISERKPAVINP